MNAAFLKDREHMGEAFIPPDISKKLGFGDLPFVDDVYIIPARQLFHGRAHFGFLKTEQPVLPGGEGADIDGVNHRPAIFDRTLLARPEGNRALLACRLAVGYDLYSPF